MQTSEKHPFIFGAQYYRAPTPEPTCWETDLARMATMGFNAVKFWVQWRWSHREPDRFTFDDLDGLMDLAQDQGLQVTLNVILDVAPLWLYGLYPDAKQMMNNGRVVEPYAVAHRQIGGHPGPCYNHPGALESRQRFMAETVDHFKRHPVLGMWDVWNEPELCFPQRTPDVQTLVCYCPHCRDKFRDWLKRKYGSIAHLNQVWGRYYGDWAQVELPRTPHTFTDFVDWREFHMDTMTGEAHWRLAMVEALDPVHTRYLHVVPNVMSVFNAVTCAADDFAMAEKCEVFAATMNGGPILASQVVSAARGKRVYNVESHINHGCTSLYQNFIGLNDLLHDFLPQIGLGIRGFLFWQYRPEVLGFEAPAWGLVKLDGSDRPVTRAAQTFWSKINPYTTSLLASQAQPAEIGIWKSRKNEIFHFAMHQSFTPLVESVEGYIQALYWQNMPFRILSGAMLERGELDGLKLLIMPAPYYLTESEAQQLDGWVRAGGVLLTEAHLGGYNGTTGKHSRILPGCGLAESWGLHEVDSTSSFHVHLEEATAFSGPVTGDVKKALEAYGTAGGEFFPIRMEDGRLIWGASRYARIAGEDLQPEGYFEEDAPCLGCKNVGMGTIYYCGTHLGHGAKAGSDGLVKYIATIVRQAGIQRMVAASGQVHVDVLSDDAGVCFLVVLNRDMIPQTVRLQGGAGCGKYTGLYSGYSVDAGDAIEVPGDFVDLFVRDMDA